MESSQQSRVLVAPRYLVEFKQFLLRGNVVDLAVGIVVGTAFGAVVAALVADLLTPLIAAIFGSSDFSGLSFTINGSHFLYGHLLNTLISFVTIAAPCSSSSSGR